MFGNSGLNVQQGYLLQDFSEVLITHIYYESLGQASR